MKKIVILFITLTSFCLVNSYGQTPATVPVTEENKVADFKILTSEEAKKVEIENQKKAEEAQTLASIKEAKDKKDAERTLRKSKSKPAKVFLISFFGTLAVGLGVYALVMRSIYSY